MNDFLLSVVAIVSVACVGLVIAVVFLLMIDRQRLKRAIQAAQRNSNRHQERLASPDFETLESLLGEKLPDSIKQHFLQLKSDSECDFEVLPPDGREPLQVFEWCPCDLESYRDVYSEITGYLPIATDGADVFYVVDPKRVESEVFSFDSDTGKLTEVADSLKSFLEWPRRSLQSGS
jgi:hypothetical protein